jgi:hypothetical protein
VTKKIDEYRLQAEADRQSLSKYYPRYAGRNWGALSARLHEAEAAIRYYDQNGVLPRWAI